MTDTGQKLYAFPDQTAAPCLEGTVAMDRPHGRVGVTCRFAAPLKTGLETAVHRPCRAARAALARPAAPT